MNLSLLRRPKRINKGTNTLYIYHPSVVTANTSLEPGDLLKILDVFEGETTTETTLKVIKAEDWDDHKRGGGVPGCTFSEVEERVICDCEKELSEMGEAFKENVHYILLSDVGK